MTYLKKRNLLSYHSQGIKIILVISTIHDGYIYNYTTYGFKICQHAPYCVMPELSACVISMLPSLESVNDCSFK